jgi:hypothetical protein
VAFYRPAQCGPEAAAMGSAVGLLAASPLMVPSQVGLRQRVAQDSCAAGNQHRRIVVPRMPNYM